MIIRALLRYIIAYMFYVFRDENIDSLFQKSPGIPDIHADSTEVSE